MFNNKKVNKVCSVCGNKISFLAASELQDGLICMKCFSKSEVPLEEIKKYNSCDIKRILASSTKGMFNPNVFFPGISFDEKNKLFGIDTVSPLGYKAICSYEDIISYNLVVDDMQVTRGGLSTAVAGAALLGTPGAIVGSSIGKRKTKKKYKSIKIKITIKNNPNPAIFVTLWDGGLPNITWNYSKHSNKYSFFLPEAQEIIEDAESIMSMLDVIISSNEKYKDVVNESDDSQKMVGEQIRYYKQLLDEELITEEEYNSLKKKLLGI